MYKRLLRRLPVVLGLTLVAGLAMFATVKPAPLHGSLVGYFASGGSFVIGDLENQNGNHVEFWGAQWHKINAMSGGKGPASFKGFEESDQNPTCGDTYNADPGNSTPPPDSIPSTMEIIVSSNISKHGHTITGDVLHIVLVKTNPGYQGNPGHAGTGTIIQQVC